MSLPKYPAYKDSGVCWLGEVPAHWDVKRLRFVAEFNPSKNEIAHLAADTQVSFLPMDAIGDDGSIDTEKSRELSQVDSGYTYFRDEDVVVAKITPCFENGKGAVMRGLLGGVGFGTTELIVARPKIAHANSDFLHAIFVSSPFRKNAEGAMYGAGGQKRVPDDFVRNFHMAFPPIAEQKIICEFIERETAKIDALIAEQEKLIALLAEKRQATISRAVTRGLDPNVPLKDSGVPWLGKVPAHWDIVALKRICDVRDGTHDTPNFIDPSEDTYPLITTKDLSEERVCFDEAKHISSADFLSISRRSGVEFGDVIMPMIGSVGGAVFVDSQKKFAIKNIALFKKGEKFISEWLRLVLNSNVSNVQFDLLRSGGVQGFVGLGGLRNLIVPYPCRDEQIAIVNFLEEKLSEIDLLDAAARNATLLLTERRAALISAAVTGKIDVRGLAA